MRLVIADFRQIKDNDYKNDKTAVDVDYFEIYNIGLTLTNTDELLKEYEKQLVEISKKYLKFLTEIIKNNTIQED